MQQGAIGDPTQSQSQQQQLVEEASPISSRPPASSSVSVQDELMRVAADEDELADHYHQRGGGGSGNRWPRQETLALLQIRSEMDAAFRDATVKAPLWENVSRKLAELGYKRSAKKCKEKFENVHKYYKRTKEGRGGRQDGKTYRFFTQLEALHGAATSTAPTITLVSASHPTPTTATSLDVSPVSVGIPMPSSSLRINPPSTLIYPAAPPPPAGFSFSSTSNGSSSSSPPTSQDDDEPSSATAGTSRKRKRTSGTHRMMEFFEGLMKQVLQKQEAMQQRFLDAIEKREHDRMVREESWRRQEMARLSREHELMAQERAISASKDAAIVSFLQKITGQTIRLPPPISIPAVPQQQPVPLAPIVTTISIQPPPPPLQPQQSAPAPTQQQDRQQQVQYQSSISSEAAIAVPTEVSPLEIGSSGSLEPSSSRWPKADVLALIKLRSGLEPRYLEAGPKGPLWEEISAGMHRMGYKRSAKRCKEKWENINKYYKKVKESNKKRPEDAKTCPYFHELDALYRKKILGTTGRGGSTTSSSQMMTINRPEQQQESTKPDNRSDFSATTLAQTFQPQTKSGSSSGADVNAGLPGNIFGEGNEGAGKKPEDIVKELMKLQGMQKQQEQQLMVHDCKEMEEDDDGKVDHEDDEADIIEEDDLEDEYEDEDDDGLQEEERKMAYKIEFQRQNTSASNGGGNGAHSFLTVVQ